MNDKQHEPSTPDEAIERYADEHVGDTGHEPNAKREPRSALFAMCADMARAQADLYLHARNHLH